MVFLIDVVFSYYRVVFVISFCYFAVVSIAIGWLYLLLMLSELLSIFSYNEIEYFIYVNLLIVSLLLFYVMLFMVIYSSSLVLNSVFYNDVFIEVFMTFVSFIYIILIISPGLMMFLDFDFISSVINFNVYVLGYQWAWNYNVQFNNLSYSFDQLILSSLSFSSSSITSTSQIINSLFGSYYSFFDFCSSNLALFQCLLFNNYFYAFSYVYSLCSISELCGQDRYLSALYFNDVFNSFNYSSLMYPFMAFIHTFTSHSLITNYSFADYIPFHNSYFIYDSAAFMASSAHHNSLNIPFCILFNLVNYSLCIPITSFINFLCIPLNYLFIPSYSLITTAAIIASINFSSTSYYLCLFSSYLLLSLYSTISLYVYSFDVIHSFGYHSFGFKSDAIPGRVNLVASLSLLFNGYFISYCYELCGISHSSMLSSVVIL